MLEIFEGVLEHPMHPPPLRTPLISDIVVSYVVTTLWPVVGAMVQCFIGGKSCMYGA